MDDTQHQQTQERRSESPPSAETDEQHRRRYNLLPSPFTGMPPHVPPAQDEQSQQLDAPSSTPAESPDESQRPKKGRRMSLRAALTLGGAFRGHRRTGSSEMAADARGGEQNAEGSGEARHSVEHAGRQGYRSGEVGGRARYAPFDPPINDQGSAPSSRASSLGHPHQQQGQVTQSDYSFPLTPPQSPTNPDQHAPSPKSQRRASLPPASTRGLLAQLATPPSTPPQSPSRSRQEVSQQPFPSQPSAWTSPHSGEMLSPTPFPARPGLLSHWSDTTPSSDYYSSNGKGSGSGGNSSSPTGAVETGRRMSLHNLARSISTPELPHVDSNDDADGEENSSSESRGRRARGWIGAGAGGGATRTHTHRPRMISVATQTTDDLLPFLRPSPLPLPAHSESGSGSDGQTIITSTIHGGSTPSIEITPPIALKEDPLSTELAVLPRLSPVAESGTSSPNGRERSKERKRRRLSAIASLMGKKGEAGDKSARRASC